MKAILAHDLNGGIGYQNTLPWGYIKRDMQHFVDITRNKVVVMGHNTFKSLGCKPLPNRRNIVLSRSKHNYEGVEIMTMDEFLGLTCTHENCVIIGGANIYNQLIPMCDELYITRVEDFFESDTFIQPLNFILDFKKCATLYSEEVLEGVTFYKYTK